MSIVALMTDFGTRDYYVGAMKGVICQINPQATIIDVTHEILRHDFYHGAFVLRQVWPYFPAGTIFVAVVDPGVGTNRRILAARYSDRIVLAPDNGLVTFLHRDAELQEIRVVENHQLFNAEVSPTFHGRDIFAPVAAHLSRGASFDILGPRTDHVDILNVPASVTRPDGSIDGEVMLVDHFGNLVTNISVVDLSAARSHRHSHDVTVGSHAVGPLRGTYAEVEPGQPIAMIGSSQMLEIGINGGSATETLGVKRGDPVRVT
jgi:S-adenosylmethionine hydrolase